MRWRILTSPVFVVGFLGVWLLVTSPAAAYRTRIKAAGFKNAVFIINPPWFVDTSSLPEKDMLRNGAKLPRFLEFYFRFVRGRLCIEHFSGQNRASIANAEILAGLPQNIFLFCCGYLDWNSPEAGFSFCASLWLKHF